MDNKAQPPEKIVWEDPEPKTHKGSKWDPLARQLRADPGRWACIGRGIPTGIVTLVRRGGLKCFQPAGSFEAATRNHQSRWVADVYLRYVGEHQEHA